MLAVSVQLLWRSWIWRLG